MKGNRGAFIRGLAVTLVVFALLFFGAVRLLDSIDEASDRAQIEMVEKAIHNAVATCYAVEGAYPDSIQYLRDHYSLAYDEKRFFVYYDAFASNIMPDIIVSVRGESTLD